jgi:hypothetical protein
MRRPNLDATTVVSVLAAVVLLAAYWLATAAASSYYRINTPQASSYSSAPEGLRATFEYLDALGLEPVALRRFEELPESGTLVVATHEPLARGFSDREADALAAWVLAGGRLVLAGEYADEALGGLDAGVVRDVDVREGTLPPLLPTPLAPPGDRVIFGLNRLLADDPAWVSAYADSGGAALLVRAAGNGEIVWLGDAYPLSNRGVGEAGNSEFMVRLLASAGQVYFDEYHHGFVAADTALGSMGADGHAALVLGALTLVVLLLARGRRLGPAIAGEPVVEARTLAYVDSLAGLYRTAGARAEALGSLAGGLERALARRHGSLALGVKRQPEAGAALAHARELGARARLDEETFVQAARRIARARREVERADG